MATYDICKRNSWSFLFFHIGFFHQEYTGVPVYIMRHHVCSFKLLPHALPRNVLCSNIHSLRGVPQSYTLLTSLASCSWWNLYGSALVLEMNEVLWHRSEKFRWWLLAWKTHLDLLYGSRILWILFESPCLYNVWQFWAFICATLNCQASSTTAND